jgi:hypothetical protein
MTHSTRSYGKIVSENDRHHTKIRRPAALLSASVDPHVATGDARVRCVSFRKQRRVERAHRVYCQVVDPIYDTERITTAVEQNTATNSCDRLSATGLNHATATSWRGSIMSPSASTSTSEICSLLVDVTAATRPAGSSDRLPGLPQPPRSEVSLIWERSTGPLLSKRPRI